MTHSSHVNLGLLLKHSLWVEYLEICQGKGCLYHSFDIKYGDIHGLIEFDYSYKFTVMNSGFYFKCNSIRYLGEKLEDMLLMCSYDWVLVMYCPLMRTVSVSDLTTKLERRSSFLMPPIIIQ